MGVSGVPDIRESGPTGYPLRVPQGYQGYQESGSGTGVSRSLPDLPASDSTQLSFKFSLRLVGASESGAFLGSGTPDPPPTRRQPESRVVPPGGRWRAAAPGPCCDRPLPAFKVDAPGMSRVKSGHWQYATRLKSRTMRVTRQLQWAPPGY